MVVGTLPGEVQLAGNLVAGQALRKQFEDLRFSAAAEAPVMGGTPPTAGVPSGSRTGKRYPVASRYRPG
jgi:hypothetical protein